MSASAYLVVYDYGPGGVWAFVTAQSKEQIVGKYPMLSVFAERPDWMSEEACRDIRLRNSFDIDDEPPHWLNAAMRLDGNSPR